jgi:aminopeptidase N
MAAPRGTRPRPPGPGVPLALARSRARCVSDLRYTFDLRIDAQGTRLTGTQRIDFVWAPANGARRALALDYRPLAGGRIARLKINGAALRTTRPVQEHLLLPHDHLVRGANRIECDLVAPILPAGGGLTRYDDATDGARYVYSLLVPSDASTVFPCFDQPDLKARFELALTVPRAWTAITNGALLGSAVRGTERHLRFAASEPISTYLFAFAAGPFVPLRSGDDADATRLWVRRSQRRRGRRNAAEVLRLNAAAVAEFAAWLATPFPFAKYDLVALPEFAYRGMEHAGATFLREDDVLLDAHADQAALLGRAQLLFHETAHQWLGNLVTMCWFDDLWLKEGFANFLAEHAARRIVPELPAALAFHALKTTAARTDATRGTTALHQPLANLSAAKSTYGPIVYAKAPAVLVQAQALLGESAFRDAVRNFVRRHAWGTADWRDLVRALAEAHGRSLAQWAKAWILREGQPVVQPRIGLDARGRVAAISLEQCTERAKPGRWPQRLDVLLAWPGGRRRVLPVQLTGSRVRLPGLTGKIPPCFVYANHGDLGCGIFLLDESSRRHALATVGDLRDPLLRAQVWESLWEGVRRALSDPAEHVSAVLRHLPRERDETIVASVLAQLRTAITCYLAAGRQAALAPAVDTLLHDGLLGARSPGLRSAWMLTCTALARTDAACAMLEDLVDERVRMAGTAPTPRLRFRAALALVALGRRDAMSRVRRTIADMPPDDARRLAYVARAATPDPAVKRGMFESWLRASRVPERWIDDCLEPLNDPRHAALTEPLLRAALDALPQIRRTHKIFFVNRWLAAFLGGRCGPQALAITRTALREAPLDPDLRRKVLQAADELERAVRIRRTFPPG